MTVAGVGIDLIEIARIERALARRPRLGPRVFSAGELAYAAAQARPARQLAARFAAKEAAIKALGLLDDFALSQVEVLGAGGPPRLALSGAAAARARALGVSLELSLTHSRETGAAVVVAVRDST